MKRARPLTAVPRHVPIGQVRRNLESVQRFRLNVVFGALLILFLGLLGRLGKLQLVDAQAYSAAASRRHDRQHTFRGLKGRILDAHGRTLVTSRRVLSVAVDPKIVENPRLFARRVAALLDDEALARTILRRILEAPPGCRHWLIAPVVDEERVMAQLAPFVDDYTATLRAGLKGLKVEDREVRTYLNGTYAAHVLGHAPSGPDGRTGRGVGIEDALNEALQPSEVTVAVQRDGGSARRCRTALAVDPSRTEGRDIRLTLDVVIQHYLETALDQVVLDWEPVFCCGVVIEPETGYVLALANRPTYDPATTPGGAFSPAVQGLLPPGSIFKPFVIATGLGLDVVRPDERLPLPVRRTVTWRGFDRTLGDSHPTGEWDGQGTVVRVIGHSSNTGAVEVALRFMAQGRPEGELSVQPFRDLFARLGFDQPTGIELCGDKPASYGRKSAWNPLFPCVGFAYGQGFAISPLRLASCFAAFARDDARIVKPTLLPGRGGPRRDLPPVCASPADLAVIREGLAQCVDEGTAQRAFVGCPYPVSGKTGTGEQPGTPYNFSGFCGFAPRERPRLLVLVVAKVDENRVHPATGVRPYGGNVSAPAARTVIERSLAYLLPEPGPAGAREEVR